MKINDTWKILPSILPQVYSRWPQQHITCLIVPVITENLKLEISNQVASYLIALQAFSEVFQTSVSKDCREYFLNEAVTEADNITYKRLRRRFLTGNE